MTDKIRIFTYAVGATLFSELLYILWLRFKHRHMNTVNKTDIQLGTDRNSRSNTSIILNVDFNDQEVGSSYKPMNKVLIFPDPGITCKRLILNGRCAYSNCQFLHKKTSLYYLTKMLSTAKTKMDVCVYMMMYSVLGDRIVDAHKKGIVVRVITDGQMGDVPSSQIGRFREAGIPVRSNSTTTFLMHHKFIIIDNETLINGSFNWTKQAVTGNYENILITNQKELVEPYSAEFQHLWQLYDPVQLEKKKDPQ
ncbi:mitochondrial cardiolipin hydrolase-like [Limulus polyphemus]|uniref:Mitochondrial cardiolipin hydrolase n=1 Tax=Limulus polyphemus TaxID=6850 RepID=A0ABM1BIU3_LIMPO|nr:mitochondrial cardiolipin hydrolase-like [Limulus polyphemus]